MFTDLAVKRVASKGRGRFGGVYCVDTELTLLTLYTPFSARDFFLSRANLALGGASRLVPAPEDPSAHLAKSISRGICAAACLPIVSAVV